MSDDDRRAARAVARILTRRTGDAEVLAQEIIAALRFHGWRPTPAGRPQPWQPPDSQPPLNPEQLTAIVNAARNELLERIATIQGTHAATGGTP